MLLRCGENKVISRLFRIHDLYMDCLCWIKPGGWPAAAVASSFQRMECLPRAPSVKVGNPAHDLNSTPTSSHLPVLSSPFLLLSAPYSKSRATVKVITMKNSTACIYGASQSSSAKSRTGSITSLWNVLFIGICSVARQFYFHYLTSLGVSVDLNSNNGASLSLVLQSDLMHCSVPLLAFPISFLLW